MVSDLYKIVKKQIELALPFLKSVYFLLCDFVMFCLLLLVLFSIFVYFLCLMFLHFFNWVHI